MASHSSITNNYKQSSKNSNMASNRRGKSSGSPHASASRPEAREKPNALDDIRAEPSTSGKDLRSSLRQEIDQMEKADLIAITKTLLEDRIDFERQNITFLERINNPVRRTGQNLQAVRAVQAAARAMQPRRPQQVHQNRTVEGTESKEIPGVKVYHRVGTRQNDRGEPIAHQMSWSNVPSNEQGHVQNKIVTKKGVTNPTDKSTKQKSKEPDTKVVQENFTNLPYGAQVKALNKVTSEICSIARHISDASAVGDSKRFKELTAQVGTLTARKKFMETHIKTKDWHHEKQRSDVVNKLQPSWLGKEGYEDVTTEWCNIVHSTLSPNKSIPQAQNQKEVKREKEKPCSCGGKCQIPLRQPPNPNPEGLTEIERKENPRERWVVKTLSELAEDVSQMLIQTPRLMKKHGLEVPDQRLQRTLEYIVTLSKGKAKGTPRPDPRPQGKGAVVSFEDEMIDKLRTYSALLWENQESFEVDKRLLANVKRTLEWIEKLRLNLHEGPEDTEKIEAMKNWQWPKGEAPPAKASAAPVKASARARPPGN